MIQTEKLKRAITLLAVVPALFFASCSNDDLEGTQPDGSTANGGDIRFEIGFAPQGGAAYAEGPQTRAATDNLFNTHWENGDEIGIFAVTSGQSLATSGNHIHNVKLTHNNGTWVPATPVYWPGSGGKLDFYAYHPYDASATDPTAIAFNVMTDQSGTTNSKSNYNLSDLLTAKSTKAGGYGKGDIVPLSFSHALAMVQVSIPVQGKGFGPGPDLIVMLRGIKTKAALDLANIGTTPGSGLTIPDTGNDAVNITMHRVEEATNTTSYTYRALVPVQAIPQGASMFWFEHEQRQLYNSKALTAGLAMMAGKAERYEVPLPQVVQTAFIPKGTFLMGSSDGTNIGDPAGTGLNTTLSEPNRLDDETQHQVTLTQDFYMSKYQVTNAQYAAFLNAKGVQGESLTYPYGGDMTGGKCTWNDNNNSGQHLVYEGSLDGIKWDSSNLLWIPQTGYDDYPVVWVTWYGAMEYACWVGGSLPTEAQWEYACRGDKGMLPFGIGDGKKLTSNMANFNGNYPYDYDKRGQQNGSSGTNLRKTTAVGSYVGYSNSYGLYDMHGNVLEWCNDWYGEYYGEANAKGLQGTSTDPTGSTSGIYRVERGGYWGHYAQYCRSASRLLASVPAYATGSLGFRVVFVP